MITQKSLEFLISLSNNRSIAVAWDGGSVPDWDSWLEVFRASEDDVALSITGIEAIA